MVDATASTIVYYVRILLLPCNDSGNGFLIALDPDKVNEEEHKSHVAKEDIEDQHAYTAAPGSCGTDIGVHGIQIIGDLLHSTKLNNTDCNINSEDEGVQEVHEGNCNKTGTFSNGNQKEKSTQKTEQPGKGSAQSKHDNAADLQGIPLPAKEFPGVVQKFLFFVNAV